MFNEEVHVREMKRGPQQEVAWQHAGLDKEVVQEYTISLAGIPCSPDAPVWSQGIDVATLPMFSSQPVQQQPQPMQIFPHQPTTIQAKQITGWHVRPDGRIYQGKSEYSSPVVKVEGNWVTTASGSVYALVNRDPAVKRVMNFLAANSFGCPEYTSADPLNASLLPLWSPSVRAVYGDWSAHLPQVLSGISLLDGESALTKKAKPVFCEEGVSSLLQLAKIAGESFVFRLRVSAMVGATDATAFYRELTLPARATLKELILAVFRALPESEYCSRALATYASTGELFTDASAENKYIRVSWAHSNHPTPPQACTWDQRLTNPSFIEDFHRMMREKKMLDETLAELEFRDGCSVSFSIPS